MTIVSNFTDFKTPDAFVREAEPQGSARGSSIGVVGIVTQAIRGPVNVPTTVSDIQDFIRKFGGYDKTLYEGLIAALAFFNQGASALKVVRVTDGTEAVATGSVGDSKFELTSPGTWGNSVKAVVTQSSASGYVDIVFQYGAKEQYPYKQVTFTDATNERYIETVLANAPEQFVEISVVGATNPASGTYTFAGGSNGTTSGAGLADSAYVGVNDENGLSGLVAFEADEEVNIIASARSTETINDAIDAQTKNVNVSPRMGVVSPAFGTAVSAVVTTMAKYNNDQLIMCYPWLQISNPYSGKKEYVSPVAFYAGVLSTLSYEQSPSRKTINGVIGTERVLTRADVDTLSQNRVSPITLIAGQGFVIRNGYNTSSNPARSNITRRRAVNFFARTFETVSQRFVSKPHTVELRNDIKSTFGSVCEVERLAGRIGNVNGGKSYAIKCDEQNNPDEVVRQNKMMVDVQISLLAPSDFILITLDASEAKVVTLQ